MNKMYNDYEVELTTLGPVHIGSFEKLTKKEYIYNLNDHSIRIVDMPKLYKILIENNLDDKYNEFILNKDEKDLYKFLKENNIKDFKRFTKYIFDISKVLADYKPFDIECFVKNAFQKLYIPGSSLKGVIRTAFINYNILENKDEYKDIKYKIAEQVYSLENDSKAKIYTNNIEEKAMDLIEHNDDNRHSNGQKDIFRFLRISDSEPIDNENIVCVPKIDIPYRIDRRNKKENKIDILKECIKPGVKIKLNLRIEDSNFFNIETIENAIKKSYDIYYENFVSKFNDFYKEKDNNIIYLGGNIGFSNKTIINSLFYKENDNEDVVEISKEILNNNKCSMEKHKNDKYVSPRMLKATKYDGKTYEFGKCRIDFKKIK